MLPFSVVSTKTGMAGTPGVSVRAMVGGGLEAEVVLAEIVSSRLLAAYQAVPLGSTAAWTVPRPVAVSAAMLSPEVLNRVASPEKGCCEGVAGSGSLPSAL